MARGLECLKLGLDLDRGDDVSLLTDVSKPGLYLSRGRCSCSGVEDSTPHEGDVRRGSDEVDRS
jgi:hypothetical protein